MAALRAMDRTDDQAQALQDPVALVPGSSLDPCGRYKAASHAQLGSLRSSAPQRSLCDRFVAETLLRVGVAPLESPGCGNGRDHSENSLARFTHSPSGARR